MRSHTAGQEILSLIEPGNIFGMCFSIIVFEIGEFVNDRKSAIMTAP